VYEVDEDEVDDEVDEDEDEDENKVDDKLEDAEEGEIEEHGVAGRAMGTMPDVDFRSCPADLRSPIIMTCNFLANPSTRTFEAWVHSVTNRTRSGGTWSVAN
jgi:hypothetical protein